MEATAIRPAALPVIPDAIPAELKGRRQWIVWRFTWKPRDQKWDKPPKQVSGKAASATDPKTWTTFDEVVRAYRAGGWDGIGYVPTEEDPFVLLDLDHVTGPDGKLGTWSDALRLQFAGEVPEPAALVATLNTYTEKSPTGTGLRVVCGGKLPKGRRKIGGKGNGCPDGLEMYSAGHYLTITGQRLPESPATVRDCDGELTALHVAVFGKGSTKKQTAKPETRTAPATFDPSTDADLIEMASQAKNGAKFKALWEGDAKGYSSQSEADLALASMLAFWTRSNPTHIESLMRQSGLKRAKWDEHKSYLADTIAKALDGCTDSYASDKPRKKDRKAKAKGRISNATIVETPDGVQTVPLPMSEVIDGIFQTTGWWPRRVGSDLFVQDGDQVCWLESAAGVFGWLSRGWGIVPWCRVTGCVSKEETFAELCRTAQRYVAIETLPHEPLLKDHYYACGRIEPGDGTTLWKFLDFFCPATPIDRQLLITLLASPLWGGPPGARPAGLITSTTGRGKGKSVLAQFIARIYGGPLDFSSGEDITVIKQRFLSTEAAGLRIALLDNLKTMRFSWAEIESLITSDIISGKKMYTGESRRPNLFTWLVTLNGASLSTDMAQRVVEIRLADPHYRERWDEEVGAFIEDNRTKIIADLIGFLRQPAKPLSKCSRWASWDGQVLARLDDPDECLATILERRGQVDVEEEEAQVIEDHFGSKLRWLGYDIGTADVFIPNTVATQWYNQATNDRRKTTGVTRALKQLHDEGRLTRLMPYRASGGNRVRGLRWVGEHCDSMAAMKMDLGHRLAEKGDHDESQTGEGGENEDF